MSRSGYTDDNDNPLATGRWRAQVRSAMRGRRGQAFLQELAASMDAMPVKELIAEELIDADGSCCTIGVVCKSRGVDVAKVDYDDASSVGAAVGIAYQMVAEIEYENDECGERWDRDEATGKYEHVTETSAERWQRMRAWVERQLIKS